MAENERQLNQIHPLRSLELRLLRCTLPSDHTTSPPPSPYQSLPAVSPYYSLINDVVTLIESGKYVQALSSSASQTLFSNLQVDSSDSAQQFYSESLPECVDSFFNIIEDSSEETGCKALLVMAVAVAALLAFTQGYITGPPDKVTFMPLVGLRIRKDEIGGCEWVEWEAWAVKELMSVGSDLHGKFSNLQELDLMVINNAQG